MSINHMKAFALTEQWLKQNEEAKKQPAPVAPVEPVPPEPVDPSEPPKDLDNKDGVTPPEKPTKAQTNKAAE